MKLIRKNNKKGFTLVELIVVIAIIAILALILIPAITGYVDKANNSALEGTARALQTKAVLYYSEKGSTEGMGTELSGAVDAKKFTVTNVDKNGTEGFKFTVNMVGKSKSIEVTETGLGTVSPAS